MSNLTIEQTNAIAEFKSELHLPNDGFHTLIIDLSRDYDLPFQVVRKCLKSSQKQIERLIKSEAWVSNPIDYKLTHWLERIHNELEKLAATNDSLMSKIEASEYYPLLKQEPDTNTSNYVAEIYYTEIYLPLRERLYTSKLYWRLKEDFPEMDSERIEDFRDYNEYYEAMLWLKGILNRLSAGS